MNFRKLNLSLSLFYVLIHLILTVFKRMRIVRLPKLTMTNVQYAYRILYIYLRAITDGPGFIVCATVDTNLNYIIAAVIILYIPIRIILLQ